MLMRDLNVEVAWNFKEHNGEFDYDNDENEIYYKAKILNIFEETAIIKFVNKNRREIIVDLDLIRLQPKDDRDLSENKYVELCLEEQDAWVEDYLFQIDNYQNKAHLKLYGWVPLKNIRKINPNPNWNPNQFKYYRRQLTGEELIRFADFNYRIQFCARAHAFHVKIENNILIVIFNNKRPIIDAALLNEYFPSELTIVSTQSITQESPTTSTSATYNETDLKCPVCNEIKSPMNIVCVNGLNICIECKDRLNECAIGHKLLRVEASAMKLNTSFVNQEKYVCGMIDCSWSGVKEELVTHWSLHSLAIVSCAEIDLVGSLKGTGQQTRLIFAFDEYFWLKCLHKTNAIFYSVQYIGPIENASKFSYRVEVGENKSFIMQRICESLDVNDKQLLTKSSDYCMIVSFTAIKRYVTNGSFKIILKIIKC